MILLLPSDQQTLTALSKEVPAMRCASSPDCPQVARQPTHFHAALLAASWCAVLSVMQAPMSMPDSCLKQNRNAVAKCIASCPCLLQVGSLTLQEPVPTSHSCPKGPRHPAQLAGVAGCRAYLMVQCNCLFAEISVQHRCLHSCRKACCLV